MSPNNDNVYYPQGISYRGHIGRRRRRTTLDVHARAEWERTTRRLGSLGEAGWTMVIKALERASGYRRGLGSEDFHIAATTRELVSHKSRAVRDEVDALIQAIMAKGSYVAREDAARALHAVVSACQDRLSPEAIGRLRDLARQATKPKR